MANTKKEKVKKRVGKKNNKCSQPKGKEIKAKRKFSVLKIQRLKDIILNDSDVPKMNA